MINGRICWYSFVALLAPLSSGLAYVVDLPAYQPSWRGQTNTTFQQWAFTTSSGGQFSYSDLNVPASPFTNAYGTPTADVIAESTGVGWVRGDNYDFYSNSVAFSASGVGWWDLGFDGGGSITLTIPNIAGGPSSVRTIIIQITEAIEPNVFEPAVINVAGGTQIGTSSSTQIEEYIYPEGGQRGNYVYVRRQEWKVPGNTPANTITITGATTGGRDSVVGGIVVDTLFNNPPVPVADYAATYENQPVVIPIAKLLANDYDLDGHAISFVSAQAGSTNGTVSVGANAVTYTPPSGFTGTNWFTYTISDGYMTADGRVDVLIRSGSLPSFNIISITTTNAGASYLITFAGTPELEYTVQRAPSVTGPWESLSPTVLVPSNGIASYYDAAPPVGTGFYRTAYFPTP